MPGLRLPGGLAHRPAERQSRRDRAGRCLGGRRAGRDDLLAGAPWPKDVPDAQAFIARYRAISSGAEPGPYAWATYQATRLLFDAMERSQGDMTRRGVGAQLARDFDARGMRPAPVYLYRLDDQGQPVLHQPRRNSG